MPTWYIIACILLPTLWGLAVAAIYDAIAVRRRRAGEAAGPPPDYEI